jgi:hypothetical protein
MIHWRFVVAAALVWFAWKGNVLEFDWPFDVPDTAEAEVEKPDERALEYVSGVEVDEILYTDRLYLSSFYSSMAFVLERDATLTPPVITSNEAFAELHAGSLRFAIDADEVGKYPKLGRQIDAAFAEAVGEDISPMTDDMRDKLVMVCQALAWRFDMGEDE